MKWPGICSGKNSISFFHNTLSLTIAILNSREVAEANTFVIVYHGSIGEFDILVRTGEVPLVELLHVKKKKNYLCNSIKMF